MLQQLSFGEFEAEAVDKLFLAMRPDACAADAVEEIKQSLCSQYGLTGTAVHRARLHITLHHLGTYSGIPRHILERAHEAAAMMNASPFQIAMGQIGSFSRRQETSPIVLSDGKAPSTLRDFHGELRGALARAGIRKSIRKSFTPHMTLIYSGQRIARTAIPPISWTAREFVLIHSHVGQTRHEVLASWTL
jgi:2'-5' RNA ligase